MGPSRCLLYLLVAVFVFTGPSSSAADREPRRLHLRPRTRLPPQPQPQTRTLEETVADPAPSSTDDAQQTSSVKDASKTTAVEKATTTADVPENNVTSSSSNGTNSPTTESSEETKGSADAEPESYRAKKEGAEIALNAHRANPPLRTSRRRKASSARRPPHAVRASPRVQPSPTRGTTSRQQNSAALTVISATNPPRRRGTATYRTSSARVQPRARDEAARRRVENVEKQTTKGGRVSKEDTEPLRPGVERLPVAAVRVSEAAEPSKKRVATSADQAATAEKQIPVLSEPPVAVDTSQEQGSSSEEETPKAAPLPAATEPSRRRIVSGAEHTPQEKQSRSNAKPSRRRVPTGNARAPQRKRGRSDTTSSRRRGTPSEDPAPREVRVPAVTKTPRRRVKGPVEAAQAPLPDQQNGIAAAAARVEHRVEPQPKAKKRTLSSSSGSSTSSNADRRRRRKKGRARTTSSAQIAAGQSQVTAVPASAPAPPPEPSLPVGKEGRKIVCYYTNWSQYRPSMGKFMPKDIDPFLCTHIVFAFSSLSGNRLTSLEENDLRTADGQPGLYAQVTALKEVNPRLQVLLAIGGWSFGTKKFKDMSGNRYNRRTFVYSAAPYLRANNFDGLDLDWEYPKGSTDKRNFAQLVRELREAFDQESQETGQERLLLTAAVPVGPDTVRSGYDVRKLARHLDLFHIMAYDFHGKWERQAGHNAPLYAPLADSAYRRQLSVNASVHMWMAMGAPKHKIVLGMPTYGRSFTLASTGNMKVNAPSRGAGTPGQFTKEEGFLAYYEICQKLHSGAVYVWDEEMSVPYMVDGDQWVGFDDERAIRIKMDFIRELDLAGAMVWSVDMDDFAAAGCGGAAYPLMSAMREELLEIPRSDDAPDIDWSKVAKRQAPPPPPPPPPPSDVSQISVADILAILKAQGIIPDPAAVQQLQAEVGRARRPSPRLSNSPASFNKDVEDNNLAPPKVFCYVTGWARDRPGRGHFTPADLDPDLCTHVVWAFAGLVQGRLQLPSDDQQRRDPDGDYQQILRLKEANTDLKILLSLGGHSVEPAEFQSLTSSDYRMNTFVYDTVDSIRRLQLDGLEVAWEYPSGPEDRAAFSRLIREFRLAFDSEASANSRSRLLLTVALPGDPADIQNGYDIGEVSQHVDFLNLMTYDLHGAWEDVVGHNAPLYPLDSAPREEKLLSLDGAARELVKAGAAPEKTLIGLATYGRSFLLEDPQQYDVGARVKDAGKPGRFSQEPGFLAYFEVCELLERENTTLVWDDEQQVPFAFNGDFWVGFDDTRSLEKKVAWLRELGFGGVQLWAADLDDFGGSCGDGPYPLLAAVRGALAGYRVPYTYDGVTAAPGSPSGTRTYGGVAAAQTLAADLVTCQNGDNDVTYHRDPADCRHYYLCQGSVRHHMPCPSDLVFNEADSVCDWPENVEECWTFTAAPPAG